MGIIDLKRFSSYRLNTTKEKKKHNEREKIKRKRKKNTTKEKKKQQKRKNTTKDKKHNERKKKHNEREKTIGCMQAFVSNANEILMRTKKRPVYWL